MNEQHHSNQKTWNGKAIADLLHRIAGGAKSRRGNIRAAVVVDYNADGNVDSRHAALADDQRASIVFGVAHFRYNREECRCASVGEDNRAHGTDGFTEFGTGNDLVVRYPDPLLWG